MQYLQGLSWSAKTELAALAMVEPQSASPTSAAGVLGCGLGIRV